jgi:hypothetical protein
MLQSHANSERLMMNHKSKFWGITGIATLCVVAACSTLLSGPSNSHAATEEPAWHRLDKSSLFLHDLTSGPATLVASMTVAPDGTVTGDLADLHELRYMHGPDGLVAARSRDAVASDVQIDSEVYFNPSEDPVMAYFEVDDGLKEVLLLSGEGVAIGELPEIMAAGGYVEGCKCICSGIHPETNNVVEQAATVRCSEVKVDHEQGESCDCSRLTDRNCWFAEPTHPELDGTMRDCKSGLIPVSTHN